MQKEIFEKILLDDNVVEKFYEEYRGNSKFSQWLDSLCPEVSLCDKQQQNNPWHKYNVLTHILHSVEAMNRQTKDLPNTDRLMLAYVMFFHDIGKPECHITRMKEGRLIDSFFNHNIASEKVARRVLNELSFDESLIDTICKLVLKHDMFMFIKLRESDNKYHKVLNNDLIREEIADLNSIGDGQKLLGYLLKVGRSDNLAQNEKMTGESLRMLDEFEIMLDDFVNKK